MEAGLIIVSFRDGDKDAHGDGGNDDGAADGLEEDGILNLPQSWVLDPHFPIEDLPDEVALLVLCHPGLVLVAVARAKTVERTLLHLIVGGSVVVFGEQLPGPQMSMMHAVENLAL